MKEAEKVSVDVAKLESLLPGKRIVDLRDLEVFSSLLDRLWKESFSLGLPQGFQQKVHNVGSYFRDYLVRSPSPYNPDKSEVLERLKASLPNTR